MEQTKSLMESWTDNMKFLSKKAGPCLEYLSLNTGSCLGPWFGSLYENYCQGKIIVGRWGDITGGHVFNHEGFDGIRTIRVCACGDADASGIHFIEVQYRRDVLVGRFCNKRIRVGRQDGCAQQNCCREEVLQDGEYINEVSGYYRAYLEDKKIKSLTFTTSTARILGPYGERVNNNVSDTTPFSVTGGKIVGFYGNGGRNFISAIGFYVLPLNNDFIKVGVWGKPSNHCIPFDHCGFEGIETLKINWNAVIDRIEVLFTNNNLPVAMGGRGGRQSQNQINISEDINQVRGYYGTFREDRNANEVETINQLTFTTNKIDENTQQLRVLGPYGNRRETFLDIRDATLFEVKGGRLAGFHGTAGRYISSIGFYILP